MESSVRLCLLPSPSFASELAASSIIIAITALDLSSHDLLLLRSPHLPPFSGTRTRSPSYRNKSRSPRMDVDTIPNFIADQRDNAPDELQHYFLSFEDFWERKLWHELTDSLVEFFQQDQSASQRLPLYNTFIKSFAEKINQLKLVTLGLSAATQCKGGSCC